MTGRVEPFLRWAGGKRWLAHKVGPLIEAFLENTYIEPFLGSGAMFFEVAPKRAILNDLNRDLINAFQIVATQPEALLESIRRLSVDSDTYYQVRASESEESFERAVRFIYLNRTCYGGLYRENQNGKFNTPYGGGSRTPAPLWEKSLIQRCHDLLSGSSVRLTTSDFEDVVDGASNGDVVYCDPTYRSTSRREFDRYGRTIFGWTDQERLAAAAERAVNRGAFVLISNVYCNEIEKLYTKHPKVVFHRSKSIGNSSKNQSYEYLILLNPLDDNTAYEKLRELAGNRKPAT